MIVFPTRSKDRHPGLFSIVKTYRNCRHGRSVAEFAMNSVVTPVAYLLSDDLVARFRTQPNEA